MPVCPVSHAHWQTLRAAKRSRKPLAGRALRIAWSRATKDGSFLTALVDAGLLSRVTGTPEAPFEATYALTESGRYAAEYGEYEIAPKHRLVGPGAPAPRGAGT